MVEAAAAVENSYHVTSVSTAQATHEKQEQRPRQLLFSVHSRTGDQNQEAQLGLSSTR